ncbi:hypothetical protein O0L34_g9109 [Tuta absoluta]|nr:hypothetical protein O0L34_g9109 [Tuta absoluta]
MNAPTTTMLSKKLVVPLCVAVLTISLVQAAPSNVEDLLTALDAVLKEQENVFRDNLELTHVQAVSPFRQEIEDSLKKLEDRVRNGLQLIGVQAGPLNDSIWQKVKAFEDRLRKQVELKIKRESQDGGKLTEAL